MVSERRPVGWSYWFTWMLATLAGFSAGFLLQALVVGLWGDRPETAVTVLAQAVALLLGGALLAVLQYLVLRRAVGGSALSGTSLTPAIGVLVGAILAGVLFASIAPFDPAAVFLVTLLGGALGGVVGETVGDVIILTMWGVFGGIVAGAITGTLLVRLLRRAAKATAAKALAAGVQQ
jgi:NhaP-type Na+/H+ or K+/H+ antiporter